VRHHHERFDGTGYPDGLRGEEIPLASRVISACDAFHAMISERPYREPLSLDAAINELHEGAGGQFDPEVVAALVGIVEAWDAPSRDEAGGQPDTDPSSEHKLEPRSAEHPGYAAPTRRGGRAVNAPAYALALKAGRGHRSLVGSNPTPSASSPRARLGLARYRSRA
jgi:HD domain-containing protein